MSKSTQIINPENMDQLLEFANAMSKSGLVPNDYQGRPNNIVVAVQWGSEVGLAPMQALQNISVINGRATVWGDSALALITSHPKFAGVQEFFEGEVAVCVVKRKVGDDVQETRREFSIDMAKKAGLWGRKGPWTSYPNRMLQMRARGFAIRDAFPDAMKGMITTEEANDTPRDSNPPHKKGEDTPEINNVIDSVAKEVEPTHDNPKTSNDDEQLTEGEVVVSPTEQVDNNDRTKGFVLHIPMCEPEYFDTRDKWVNRYRQLMSMVKEGKLPSREKMTNLKKLEEVNVKMLDSFGAAGDELRELRGKLTRLIGAESAGQNE